MKSLAQTVCDDFSPEHRVLAVEPGARLNGSPVPPLHRYAVLDCESETLATGRTRAAAVDAAARVVLREFARRAEGVFASRERMHDALRVLLAEVRP